MFNAFSRWRMLALSACVAAAGACGSDATEPARATTVTPVSSQVQTVVRSGAVPEPPAVRVTDQNGQPMEDVAVTFSVTSGGGTLVGGATRTDASGLATLGGTWTVGSTPTMNTLSATATGLAPVVFTATAYDPCVTPTAHTINTTLAGSLDPLDCTKNEGISYSDFFSVTLQNTEFLSFNVASIGFEPILNLPDPDSSVPVWLGLHGVSDVVAPPGTHILSVRGTPGAYELKSRSLEGPKDCTRFYIMPGTRLEGDLEASGCMFGRFIVDEYLVYLKEGQTLTVRMSSNDIDAAIYLFDLGDSFIWGDSNSGGGTDALMTYTAPSSGMWVLRATSPGGTHTGHYTLEVARSPAPSAGGGLGQTGAYTPTVTRSGGSAAAAASESRRPQAPTRVQRRLPVRGTPASR